MDIKYQALKKGLFRHTNKPGLIKEVLLENYIDKCLNRTKLINEIVYCLITPIEQRLSKEHYRVAYNSGFISNWEYKIVYPKIKYFKSLKDLIIINISILETNRDIIFNKYKWFKEELIYRLENYGE